MSKIVEEVTDKGLVVPNTVLEQGGIAEGSKVVIESYNKTIVIKPEALNARDIAKRARVFLLWKIGDATDVKLPIKEGNRWRVTVVLAYLKKELGQLTYTLDGILVPEESNSVEQLKTKANED